MNQRNLSMLCDFYELTMGNGYFKEGFDKKIAYFDVFFRNVPDGGGFAIAAGLEQVVEYIQQLHFDDEDIEFLREKHIFDEQFLTYLRNFHFSGDIYAVPEGTPVFPGEPILTVRAAGAEPSDHDRHQGMPDCSGSPGARGIGVWLPSCPGRGRSYHRRKSGLYRRLCRHRLHHQRPNVWCSCFGHHGPQLGAAVPHGVRGL